MKTNNALVTYTDLTTMGLLPQANVTPPTGNRCATKSFINTYYHADAAALSGYTSNRLPPYQAVIPDTVPFLLCYNLTITYSTVYDSCGNPQTAENWAISLVDQFGNAYITPVTLNFGVSYDYIYQTDIPPYYETGTTNTNISVLAGSYQGFGQYIQYAVEACPFSSSCDGSCYTSISNVTLTSTPGNIEGGCGVPASPPAPPNPCAYSQVFFPGNMVDDPSSPTGVLWKWSGYINGKWEFLNYSCFSNASWTIEDLPGNIVYSGTGTYVPWNGLLNNSGIEQPAGSYWAKVNLKTGDGSSPIQVAQFEKLV